MPRLGVTHWRAHELGCVLRSIGTAASMRLALGGGAPSSVGAASAPSELRAKAAGCGLVDTVGPGPATRSSSATRTSSLPLGQQKLSSFFQAVASAPADVVVRQHFHPTVDSEAAPASSSSSVNPSRDGDSEAEAAQVAPTLNMMQGKASLLLLGSSAAFLLIAPWMLCEAGKGRDAPCNSGATLLRIPFRNFARLCRCKPVLPAWRQMELFLEDWEGRKHRSTHVVVRIPPGANTSGLTGGVGRVDACGTHTITSSSRWLRPPTLTVEGRRGDGQIFMSRSFKGCGRRDLLTIVKGCAGVFASRPMRSCKRPKQGNTASARTG